MSVWFLFLMLYVFECKINGIYLRPQERSGKERIVMKRLFNYADRYIKRSDWKDLAMIKFCLFSIGMIAGMRMPERNRKQAEGIAAVVFVATYIPLMAKFFAVMMEKEE